MKILKKVILVLRVIALCKFMALKTCNQDISKTITASSFKLGQLREDNRYNVDNLVKIKKYILFLAHLSRRLMGELIVYQSIRRLSVNIFKHLLL